MRLYDFSKFNNFFTQKREIIKLGGEIYSDMINLTPCNFYVAVTNSEDEQGYMSHIHVYVFENFEKINEFMNMYEYKKEAVEIYYVDRDGYYIDMYYKMYTACGFHRLAQCCKLKIEALTIYRKLFDWQAYVTIDF